MSTLTKGLEGLTREVEEAATMERAYLAIRAIEFLGQFYAFQMVADLVEHGILNFRSVHLPRPVLAPSTSLPLLTPPLQREQLRGTGGRRGEGAEGGGGRGEERPRHPAQVPRQGGVEGDCVVAL